MRTVLTAFAAILALSGCQKQDDAAFGARVRTYLLAHPEVLNETIDALKRKQAIELVKEASEAIGKYRAQLERDPRDLVINPAGSITVVEFFDFNCGYCKLVAPEVARLVRDNPDVRFVFKQYAFQTEQSVYAAKLALTPAARAKPLELYTALMAQKPLDAAAIDRALAAAGVDAAAAHAAASSPGIERQLLDTHALASALKIEGTPNFIVGDTLIPGADIEALKAAIAQAKSKRKGPQAT